MNKRRGCPDQSQSKRWVWEMAGTLLCPGNDREDSVAARVGRGNSFFALP